MGVPDSERRAASSWTHQELVRKVDVANSNCTQWKNEVTKLEEARDYGILDYIPATMIYKAVTSSDELDHAKQTRDDWCDRLRFYSAEIQKRRKVDPEAVRSAEAEAYDYRTRQREEVRDRAAASAEKYAPRTEFGGSETMIGGAAQSITSLPGRAIDGAMGLIGLGQDQTTSERVVGLGRLSLAVVLGIAAYLVVRGGLSAGAAIAERSAERSGRLLSEFKDTPIVAGPDF